MEVEVALEELASMLGDELELPNIQPKGTANVVAEKSKYNSIRQTGPESLRHFKRTYLNALRRQISTGKYQPDDPKVVPIKRDKKYRSWNDIPQPQVNEHTFYHTRESGGTRISSAYQVCAEMIDKQFPVADWNIYCFQFSDGDNWGDDNRQAFDLLGEKLLPASNVYCYGQVESPYGSGDFIDALEKEFSSNETLVLSEIPDKEGIYASIKTFLGKGK
jgi:hypothetical protein